MSGDGGPDISTRGLIAFQTEHMPVGGRLASPSLPRASMSILRESQVDTLDKKKLSERDICTKYITPAIAEAGWDRDWHFREEVTFTEGRVIVRGKLVTRGPSKRADYILYHKPNLPIGVIEAKDNTHAVGDGMQQALDYAETLDVPFAFSSNGDAFLAHDRTGLASSVEQELMAALDGQGKR